VGRRSVKILVLSFYYKPDLSAGSFRASALVDALRKRLPPGSHLDVVTSQPNRYQSFAVDAPTVEQHAGLSIFRVAVPTHQSGFVDQSKAFATFVYQALKYVADRDYDLVFATSSRLMTAALGAWVAQSKHARLYLDIRDIFTETIDEVLSPLVRWFVGPVVRALERWTIGRADKVNLISPGFSEYFHERYPQQRFSFFTNGIDEEFLAVGAMQPIGASDPDTRRTLTVLYAGNIGEGQGLHDIVPKLAKSMGQRVCFQIIGDGGRKGALEASLVKNGVKNVKLLPPMKRDELISAYRAADVLFVHLNGYAAFKRVLPSKLFEFGALGKPVWAGVSGYAAEFVRSEIDNAAVFEPCDVEGAIRAFDKLALEDAPRAAFVAKYARSNIDRALAEDILAIGK
jgi:glycosyltransferase involved in cell wall biosynthesis